MIPYGEFDKNFSLKSKTAVITGAAKGIGNAIARLYAEKGANIVIFDVDSHKGSAVAKELQKNFGVRSLFLSTNILNVDNLQESTDRAEKEFGSIDILVNNAGVAFLDSAETLTEHAWDTTIGVNLKAVFLLSQIIGRKMLAQGHGKIVNIASQAGIVALDKHAAYCASKAGVISLTKVLALEWAKSGININSISPTVVLTELGIKAWAGEVGENMKKQIPNRRFAHPDEIAAVAVFLASDAAAMINGENIVIDGGYTIQ